MPLPPRKAMSWQSDASGGALVRPAGAAGRKPVSLLGIGPSPFLSRLKGKSTRREGEVWQGDSGRWFTLKNGRSVPAKAPGGESGTASPDAVKPAVESTAGTPATNSSRTPLPDNDALQKSTYKPFVHNNSVHGSAGDIGKVTLDGKQYFFKKLDKDVATNEVLAAHAAKVCGVEAPSARIVKLPNGKQGIITVWSDGEALADRIKSGGDVPKIDADVVDRHLAFTYLIALQDRHLGNYMIDATGGVSSIDHEFAFGYDDANPPEEQGSRAAGHAEIRDFRHPADKEFSRDILREIASKAEGIARILASAKMNDAAAGVLRRGRELAELADASDDAIETVFLRRV